MHITELDLITRVAVGWGLTFILGFERAVRGAPAGDRTFSLVGAGTALIGTLSLASPAVLGGAVTGIGFIGGGLCFRQAAQDKEILHGITTAASIFAAAAIGAAAGIGHLELACAAAAAVFVSLEIRHLPIFRLLDARRWQPYFNHDDHAHFTIKSIESVIMHPLKAGAECAPEPVAAVSAAAGPGASSAPELVEQAIVADIAADQMIEASAARGGR
ncbi:MAG TPA: MgtC/SapB family protein [Actinocrinis sp.]|nr:MgtC/SapB family protein [Actinocrinis sp.]